MVTNALRRYWVVTVVEEWWPMRQQERVDEPYKEMGSEEMRYNSGAYS